MCQSSMEQLHMTALTVCKLKSSLYEMHFTSPRWRTTWFLLSSCVKVVQQWTTKLRFIAQVQPLTIIAFSFHRQTCGYHYSSLVFSHIFTPGCQQSKNYMTVTRSSSPLMQVIGIHSVTLSNVMRNPCLHLMVNWLRQIDRFENQWQLIKMMALMFLN